MMDATQLRPEFVEPLAAVDTGQITPPVESQMGFHILKLLERTPGRPLDLNTDFDTIREMARRQKTSRLVEQWVNELKKKTYVDIRSLDGT
jgi:parvulin-like peptidyl-prolyl isomerase